MKFRDRSSAISKIAQGFLAIAAASGIVGLTHRSAIAQSALRQAGTLPTMEDVHTFEGQPGQMVTVQLQSDDFEPFLVVEDSSGEFYRSDYQDYDGDYSSAILTLEIPKEDTYRITVTGSAASSGRQGGNYSLEVRFASEYEQLLSQAILLSDSRWDDLTQDFRAAEYDGAIQLYTEALAVDETEPRAYIGRIIALTNRTNDAEINFSKPDEWPEGLGDMLTADYLKAAELFEQQGNAEIAEDLRFQASLFELAGENAPSDDVSFQYFPIPFI